MVSKGKRQFNQHVAAHLIHLMQSVLASVQRRAAIAYSRVEFKLIQAYASLFKDSLSGVLFIISSYLFLKKRNNLCCHLDGTSLFQAYFLNPIISGC